jgi:hypothetical protein
LKIFINLSPPPCSGGILNSYVLIGALVQGLSSMQLNFAANDRNQGSALDI